MARLDILYAAPQAESVRHEALREETDRGGEYAEQDGRSEIPHVHSVYQKIECERVHAEQCRVDEHVACGAGVTDGSDRKREACIEQIAEDIADDERGGVREQIIHPGERMQRGQHGRAQDEAGQADGAEAQQLCNGCARTA